MIEETVSTLAIPSQQSRDDVLRMEHSIAAHDAAMAGIEAMNRIEISGAALDGRLAFPFSVAAWNLERCLFPQESAEQLGATGASLVMLSEMDNGMARTGQCHTTAEVAATLGMQYAYGVEFVELDLGADSEREFCQDDFNEKGFHGNALLTSIQLRRPFMIRLWGSASGTWMAASSRASASVWPSAPSSRPRQASSSPSPPISKARRPPPTASGR